MPQNSVLLLVLMILASGVRTLGLTSSRRFLAYQRTTAIKANIDDSSAAEWLVGELRFVVDASPPLPLCELRQRLHDLLAETSKLGASSRSSGDSGSGSGGGSDGTAHEPTISSLTVKELKAMLKMRGVSLQGENGGVARKAELARRLLATVALGEQHLGEQHQGSGANDGAGKGGSPVPSPSPPPAFAFAEDGAELSAADESALALVALQFQGKGPQSGVFTDGCCQPSNPGPGGWGAVCVTDGRVVWRVRGGSGGATATNNAMEMAALVGALERLAPGETAEIFSDSQLCVQTLNDWAVKWEANGWTRGQKREEVKNVELVRRAHRLLQARRPHVTLSWIKVRGPLAADVAAAPPLLV